MKNKYPPAAVFSELNLLAEHDAGFYAQRRVISLLRLTGILSVALFLSACASKVWNKPGASQADFAQSRYVCMQQSQQGFSSAAVNKYGGSAQSSVITNNDLFSACMNNQGWSLGEKKSPEQQAALNTDIKETRAELDAEYMQMCAREDLKPFFSKTSCLTREITLEQMADKSRITQSEKAATSKAQSELVRLRIKEKAFIRQYYANATAFIIVGETSYVEQDKNLLDFYEGRITRGDFNKRRQELKLKMDVDLQNTR